MESAHALECAVPNFFRQVLSCRSKLLGKRQIRRRVGWIMFETIKDQLTDASEKLAHLRRFL